MAAFPQAPGRCTPPGLAWLQAAIPRTCPPASTAGIEKRNEWLRREAAHPDAAPAVAACEQDLEKLGALFRWPSPLSSQLELGDRGELEDLEGEMDTVDEEETVPRQPWLRGDCSGRRYHGSRSYRCLKLLWGLL